MSEAKKLPNREEAWVEEKKVRRYLLNVDHKEGGPKAEYFMRRGFTLDGWEIMRDALAQHGNSNPLVEIVDDRYTKLYVVECSCITPDGTNPCIRSVWEVVDPENRPRLVSAYPFK